MPTVKIKKQTGKRSKHVPAQAAYSEDHIRAALMSILESTGPVVINESQLSGMLTRRSDLIVKHNTVTDQMYFAIRPKEVIDEPKLILP